MTIDLIYNNAKLALEDFRNGNSETLTDAANKFSVNKDILNVMYGNEDLFSEGIFVDQITANNRLSICNGCENKSTTPPIICSLCSCNIGVITVMKLKRCDKGLW